MWGAECQRGRLPGQGLCGGPGSQPVGGQQEVVPGTADAVRQYLWLFDNAVRDGVEDFLILSGVGALRGLQQHGLQCQQSAAPGLARA